MPNDTYPFGLCIENACVNEPEPGKDRCSAHIMCLNGFSPYLNEYVFPQTQGKIMSTSDVPGNKKEHHDELGHGCWAEHEDGSLILVQSTEDKRVIYDVFDLKPGVATPEGTTVSKSVIEYRDVKAEKEFKKDFSYDPAKGKKDGVNEEWTWHDKTPFPWQRVIDAGMKLAELKHVDPTGVLTTAAALGNAVSSATGTGADAEPFANSDELLTAAQRVAATLKLKGKAFHPSAASHLTSSKGGKTAKATVMGRIKGAFSALRGG